MPDTNTTNGRHRISLANLISFIAMGGALAVAWANLAADNATTTKRVDALEENRVIDRTEAKEERKEIKDSVRSVDGNVQLILRRLDVMEAQRSNNRER